MRTILAFVLACICATAGVDVVASSPEEFGAFLKSEVARWGKVVQEANIKAD